MPLRFPEPARQTYQYPLTIRHLLASVLLTSADQKIIYRDQISYAYRDLPGRLGRLASFLTQLGATEGMTIAMLDWDSHRYLETYFAVPMMGSVLQTVNVRLPAAQIAYTLDHANAEILIVHRDFFPLVEAMLPSLPAVKAVVAIMDGATDPLPGWADGEYEQLSAEASPDFPFADFDENAIATTFYTSGTTGNPKGVCFTHRQLVLHTLAINAPFGVSDQASALGLGDVYMPLTPMFHVNAWGMPFIATMLGVKQVYPGRYEPDMICRLRKEHGVSFSHCVPTILRMILDAASVSGTDLSGWKMTIGGSALPKPLFEEADSRGMRILAGYGMSETCPTVSVARLPGPPADVAAEMRAEYLTASGVPTPLVHVRIVDDQMRDVPHDGVSRGELVVRAPWLTPCYTGNPEASETLWSGGWLHTQDVATIDAAGYIRIRDRLKDVIKSGGEWIDSIHLEDLVRKADGVADVAVVAIADQHWGERPLAVIVAEAGAAVTLDAINVFVEQEIAKGRISRYAKIQRFELIEALPLTSVGKYDKKLLRQQFGSPFERAGAAAAL